MVNSELIKALEQAIEDWTNNKGGQYGLCYYFRYKNYPDMVDKYLQPLRPYKLVQTPYWFPLDTEGNTQRILLLKIALAYYSK